MVSVHPPAPEHPAPLQPVKVDPAAGAAAKVTTVPEPRVAEHVPGHEIPAGELLTVPDPVPAVDTVRVCDAVGSGSGGVKLRWASIPELTVPAPRSTGAALFPPG
jgi:hypothetical protein